MALGTPVGAAVKRDGGTSNITIPSFTSAADELILCAVSISGGGSQVPDSLTGHDGKTAWGLVGSTEQSPSSRFSISLYAAHSSGETGTLVVAYSTTSGMQASMVRVTGADVSGTLANSFDAHTSANGYGTTLSAASLTGASLTIGFFGVHTSIALTVEGTEITNQAWFYNDKRTATDYDAAGDATPTASVASNRPWACQTVEIKAAGAAANPKGVFGMPLFRPLRGPL